MIVTHENVYELFSVPGPTPPQPGDVIRLNYGEGMRLGYWIKSVHPQADGSLSFICRLPGEENSTLENANHYLHDFEMVHGRCVNRKSYVPGTAIYFATGGGRDGDGRPEILIERRAAQLALFDMVSMGGAA